MLMQKIKNDYFPMAFLPTFSFFYVDQYRVFPDCLVNAECLYRLCFTVYEKSLLLSSDLND